MQKPFSGLLLHVGSKLGLVSPQQLADGLSTGLQFEVTLL